MTISYSALPVLASGRDVIEDEKNKLEEKKEEYNSQIELPDEYLGPIGMDKLADIGSNVVLMDSYSITITKAPLASKIGDSNYDSIVDKYNACLNESKNCAREWFDVVKKNCFNTIENIRNYGDIFAAYSDYMVDLADKCINGIDVDGNQAELADMVKELRDDGLAEQQKAVINNIDSIICLRDKIFNLCSRFDSIANDIKALEKSRENDYFSSEEESALQMIEAAKEMRATSIKLAWAAVGLGLAVPLVGIGVSTFCPPAGIVGLSIGSLLGVGAIGTGVASEVISGQASDLEQQGQKLLTDVQQKREQTKLVLNSVGTLKIETNYFYTVSSKGADALERFKIEWEILNGKYTSLYKNMSGNRLNVTKWKRLKADLILANRSWKNVEKEAYAIQKGLIYSLPK